MWVCKGIPERDSSLLANPPVQMSPIHTLLKRQRLLQPLPVLLLLPLLLCERAWDSGGDLARQTPPVPPTQE